MKATVKGLALILCLVLCTGTLLTACTTEAPSDGNGTPFGTENTPTEQPTEPLTPGGEDALYNYYTVYVKTAEGGIENAMVQLCNEVCLTPVRTDATGKATVKLAKDQVISDYHVKMFRFPTGYTGSTSVEYRFEAGADSLTITLAEYKVSVNDMFGAGVPNTALSVFAAPNGNKVAEGKTDAAGNVTFLLDAGAYEVTAKAPEGYQLSGDTERYAFSEEGRIGLILTTLSSEITKTVTVTDAAGAVRAGVAVRVTTPDETVAFDGVTDAAGQISFTGDAYTNYAVCIGSEVWYFESFASTSLTVVPQTAQAQKLTYVVELTDAEGKLLSTLSATALLIRLDDDLNETVVQTLTLTGGQAQVVLDADSYFVRIEGLDAAWVARDPITGFFDGESGTKLASVILQEKREEGIEENPALWQNVNFAGALIEPTYTVTLNAGQVYWVTLARSFGLKMTLTGDATVVYKDVTYRAGDTIYFSELSPREQQALFTVTAGRAGSVTLTVAEVVGIANNPEPITGTSGTLTVDLTASSDGYWYTYTATAAGRFAISSESTDCVFTLNPLGGGEAAGNSTTITLAAGESVTVLVTCGSDAKTLTVTWSFTAA